MKAMKAMTAMKAMKAKPVLKPMEAMKAIKKYTEAKWHRMMAAQAQDVLQQELGQEAAGARWVRAANNAMMLRELMW